MLLSTTSVFSDRSTCWFLCVRGCVGMCVCLLISYHEQLQQQHQQKQQALGRWEFWVVVKPRASPAPLRAEVSLRPPPMASSPPSCSAGIGPVYCTETETQCNAHFCYSSNTSALSWLKSKHELN